MDAVRQKVEAHIDSRKAGMIEARHRFARFVSANYRHQHEPVFKLHAFV